MNQCFFLGVPENFCIFKNQKQDEFWLKLQTLCCNESTVFISRICCYLLCVPACVQPLVSVVSRYGLSKQEAVSRGGGLFWGGGHLQQRSGCQSVISWLVHLWYRSSSECVLTLLFSHSRRKSAAFWTWQRSQNTARKWGEWLRADKWSLYRLQFTSFFSGWAFKLHCADLNWLTKMEQCPNHLITGRVIRQTLLFTFSADKFVFVLFCFFNAGWAR